MMLLELAISVVLVGALLTMALRLLHWTARQQRADDRRTIALIECGNVLDELTSLPWDTLTGDGWHAPELSAQAQAILPDGQLHVTLDPLTDPEGRRITVSIDWLGDNQSREGPIQLSAWVYR